MNVQRFFCLLPHKYFKGNGLFNGKLDKVMQLNGRVRQLTKKTRKHKKQTVSGIFVSDVCFHWFVFALSFASYLLLFLLLFCITLCFLTHFLILVLWFLLLFCITLSFSDSSFNFCTSVFASFLSQFLLQFLLPVWLLCRLSLSSFFPKTYFFLPQFLLIFA